MMAACEKFKGGRVSWDKLGRFQGLELPEPSRRVSDVLELWQAPINVFTRKISGQRVKC